MKKVILLFLLFALLFIQSCQKDSPLPNGGQPPVASKPIETEPIKPKESDAQTPDDSVPLDHPLLTETLSIYSQNYGNTNGNLNNQSLAVYDTMRHVHYYSSQQSIYRYDPATDQTELCVSLSTGGRPIYLNLDGSILYFLDSSNGHLLRYDLDSKDLSSLVETENTFLGRNYSSLHYILNIESYGSVYPTYRRYAISDGRLSDSGTYIGLPNFDGTRIYYHQTNSLLVRVMDVSGMGKATIIDLITYNVTTLHELLFYHKDSSNITYFMLILTVGSTKGLYRYNQTDGLVKIIDASSSLLHGLNYDGTYGYFIHGTTLNRLDLSDDSWIKLADLPGSFDRLQIINRWFYVSEIGGTQAYRVHPVTPTVLATE